MIELEHAPHFNNISGAEIGYTRLLVAPIVLLLSFCSVVRCVPSMVELWAKRGVARIKE